MLAVLAFAAAMIANARVGALIVAGGDMTGGTADDGKF